jgi:enoyl-CoA hydratase/carnithine racemase
MSKVLYEKKGKIAWITLNRPEKLNSIDRDMNKMLDSIWRDFKKDDSLWVAIITGAGNHFCAGFDIQTLANELKEEKYQWAKSAMFGDYRSSPNELEVFKPIIAAMDGVVNGMGTWLMLQSDIRIATEGTTIGLGEAKINFPVEFSAFITRFLPYSIASELFFTAKSISSRRFFEIGMINKIVSRERLLEEAEIFAEAICQCGPQSIQVMKELMIRGQNMDYASAVAFTGSMVVPIVNAKQTQEALAAFLEKRKHSWK